MVHSVAVEKVDTVEEKTGLGKIQEIHLISEYLAEDHILDMTLGVYLDTVADEVLYSAAMDSLVGAAEMVLVVVVAAVVAGQVDHIENMGEVLHCPSLRHPLDHEEDSVDVDDYLCYLGDFQREDLLE
jgi:hypothetical protein